jgi:hypothetical protein
MVRGDSVASGRSGESSRRRWFGVGLKKLKLRFSGLSARMMEVLALRIRIIVFFMF